LSKDALRPKKGAKPFAWASNKAMNRSKNGGAFLDGAFGKPAFRKIDPEARLRPAVRKLSPGPVMTRILGTVLNLEDL
jgi:hypothetical protein